MTLIFRLAEKKYGLNANHLKGKKEFLEQRAKMRAERLAKMKASGRDRQPQSTINVGVRSHTVKDDEFFSTGPSVREGYPPATQGHMTSSSLGSKPDEVVVEKPVHPSWEAKMRLKQKEALKLVRPAGKKIVFD